ncbi:MAG: SprT family zinc-dependent metalloprotease [Bacteroidota bacterium]|nr:SprT family zinc-dependent metalloprotease [Bacteroidota bacterium]MDP4230029.1 SprT family zinc-dependent metalloprotease [Bacteroidota bacterium]MDP4234838.1 SprT family zinc-dependent metalloprotease [Bacteroidota bacterium]
MNPKISKYIVERKKVKYARITVHHDCRVKVTIPLRYTDSDLLLFLAEQANWIEKHVSNFGRDSDLYLSLGAGEIPFLGEAINPGFEITDKRVLEQWYRKAAKEYLFTRIEILSAIHGYRYNRVSIRDAKTRWGSCSIKKNISLNWRLMKAPPHIIDYVILHELVHTVVFNHSKLFWTRVAECCPEYSDAKKWLKRFGKFLYWD